MQGKHVAAERSLRRSKDSIFIAVRMGCPLAMQQGINPNLMVLSIGAGSLILGHVNDGGFWLFKEYFNLSVKDTFKTWSVMETIISVLGLAGVLIINIFI